MAVDVNYHTARAAHLDPGLNLLLHFAGLAAGTWRGRVEAGFYEAVEVGAEEAGVQARAGDIGTFEADPGVGAVEENLLHPSFVSQALSLLSEGGVVFGHSGEGGQGVP